MTSVEIASYDYQNAAGELVFQSVRYDPKGFRFRRPDGQGGWIYDLDGVQKVPYRLPQVLAADTVYIVEGEKDVHTVEGFGLVATCNAGGAKSWLPAYNEVFRGKHVVILPDQDTDGWQLGDTIGRNLLPVAASVRVVNLPVGTKGDVTDWRYAGGTREALDALVESSGTWVPGVHIEERHRKSAPIPDAIFEGQGRHKHLVSVAGSMRHRGLNEQEILAALVAVNANRCKPAYDHEHLLNIAKSMERYPADGVVGEARDRVPVEQMLLKAVERVRAGDSFNIAGLDLFGELRAAGYDRDEASLSLREWVRAANEAMPGQDKYTMREAEATLHSAYKREAREPWDTDGKENQADILLAMTEDFEYFKSGPANEGYVRVAIGDHSEVWPAGNGKGAASSKVREILTHRFLEKYARAPGREALNAVGDTVVAKCSMGPKVDVHVRFARARDVIYLDMCDDRWRAIEVDASGWRVVERPAVLFKRHSGARALPVPVAAGTLEALRPLLNSGDESQWLLMVAWLAGAFLPEGAFAHLVLEGEQGSAKSTTARILQSLLDPSDAGLSSPPKDETDATVSALNAGILAYDNLSGCRAEMADIFCRFSTGQGYRTRTLYETLGITVAAVKLPILLNGIDSTVMRGDLLERSITLKLPRIPTQNRRTEQGIWADFAGMHAGVLGALLDAVSCGLRNLPNTTVPDAPRMSDFCTWVAACEPALPWKPGQFLAAYRGRMEEANRDLADNDPVASALVDWADQWLKPGTVVQMVAKDLLIALNEVTSDCPKDMRRWPPDAQSLAFRLVRLAPVLKAQGIEVRRLKRTNKARSRWEIRRPGPQALLLPRFVEDGSEVEDDAA